MRTICFAIILLAFQAFAFAQDTPVFSIKPEKPAIGSEITVTYHAHAPSAKLKDESAITAEMLIYRDPDQPRAMEQKMSQDGKSWTAKFSISEKNATVLLFRFVSGPEKTDDNDGNVWDVTVCNGQGNPVQGAHLQRAKMLQNGGFYTFSKKRDLDAAKNEAELELTQSPENLKASLTLWSIMLKNGNTDEVKNSVRAGLERIADKATGDEKMAGDIIAIYNALGDTVKVAEIKKAVTAKFPNGELVKSDRATEIYKEKDPEKKLALYDRYCADFSDVKTSEKNDMQARVVNAFYSAKRLDDGVAYMEKHDMKNGGLYNEFAWSLIEKGEQLEKALGWAKKAVEFSRNPDRSDVPAYITPGQQEQSEKYSLSAALDTYGYGFYQDKKYDDAEKTLREAYEIMKGEDPDMNTHYVNAMLKNKNYDGVQKVGIACVKSGKGSDDVMAAFKTAYLEEKKGSENDFNAMIDGARAEMMAKMRTEILANRLSTPMIDFTLNDLAGAPATLSAMKGKVIVIDFWATWCGPCKASFPFLQKVYDKYKDNPKVQFFAINVWERMKAAAEKLANAKQFIEKTKYTFPVLLDPENKVVGDYEVDGIPTQFIIDRKGNIAFKNVGFEGPVIEDKLTQMIEILLSEEVGAK